MAPIEFGDCSFGDKEGRVDAADIHQLGESIHIPAGNCEKKQFYYPNNNKKFKFQHTK
jgi:hypothetical protein